MSKKFGAIALVALLAIGFVTSGAFASTDTDDNSETRATRGSGGYGEELRTIIEEGTYQDLVDLRADTGLDLMPYIDSEDDFEAIQDETQDRIREKDGLSSLFDTGTYEDLENLREELGKNIMPWIDSEDEFDQAKELGLNANGHTLMGYMGDASGKGHMRGPGNGMKHQYDGDCPNQDTEDSTE